METYLIGVCSRVHSIIPAFILISAPLAFISLVMYINATFNIIDDLASDYDCKVIKYSKTGLIVSIVVLVLSLILLIFIPEGEEVRLMIQE